MGPSVCPGCEDWGALISNTENDYGDDDDDDEGSL